MAIVFINPNSTASMTDAMVSQARKAAPELVFEGWTSQDGPPAIQGAEDGEAATDPLLRLVERASGKGAQGIVIGCFDDTALMRAADLADCPVVGLGQAAYHYAALRNWRFSVVTTLSVSVPVLQQNIAAYGLSDHLSRVRASDVPVLELERQSQASERMVLHEALQAQEHDDISAVILGCAGMVSVFEHVSRGLRVKTIDPVVCAAQSMRWLLS